MPLPIAPSPNDAALGNSWHDNLQTVLPSTSVFQVDHLGTLLTRDRYKDVISHYQRLKRRGANYFRPGVILVASGLSQDHQAEKAQSIMTELFYHKGATIALDFIR